MEARPPPPPLPPLGQGIRQWSQQSQTSSHLRPDPSVNGPGARKSANPVTDCDCRASAGSFSKAGANSLLLLVLLGAAAPSWALHAAQPASLRLCGGGLPCFKRDSKPEPVTKSVSSREVADQALTGAGLMATTSVFSYTPEKLFGLSWQPLLASSFAAFSAATSVPGRLDIKLGKPKTEDMRFFTPAPWAFAIWGAIFLGEMAMAVSAFFFPGSLSGSAASGEWLQRMAPFYAAASIYQVLWCGAFREWASNKLWLPASLLTLAAVSLFEAHGVMAKAAKEPGAISRWGYICTVIPVTMHFGWMTAAAALSWNNFLNSAKLPRAVQLTAAIASCYAAAGFLGYTSINRRDPVPSLVAAWSLLAVSKGHEVLRGAVDALALDTLNFTAFATSVASLLMALWAGYTSYVEE